MQEIPFDPDILTIISDNNQVQGLSASYIDLEQASVVSPTLLRKLSQEISKLPTQQRRILKHIRNGLNDREIADKMNITRFNVAKQKKKAINKLKNQFRNM